MVCDTGPVDPMSKYDGITRLLRDRTEPTVTIGWEMLDRAVGGLPASARDHQPWWHGDRAQVRAWRAAGYGLERVEPGRAVTFRRVTTDDTATLERARRPTPAQPMRSLPDASGLTSIASLVPLDTLVVIPCSKRKAIGGLSKVGVAGGELPVWSPALDKARASVAAAAQRDDRLLLPAWQRYTGTFYTHAFEALTEATRQHAPVLILSGGYGVLEATEPIGWYERRLRLGDWPPRLLGREIAHYAEQRGLHSLVAFAGGASAYAHVIRSTDWPSLGLPHVVLVTAESAGGAQVSVPRDLSLGFSSWCRHQVDAAPLTLRAESLVSGNPSPRASPSAVKPTPAGTGHDGTADTKKAVAHLADRAHAIPAHALDPREPALQHPGLYAWWADEEALHLLRHSLGQGIGPLIYAGQAGATTRRRAITRAATLKSRIVGQHLRAQTRGSTFALTLAAALREPLGLTFADPRKIDTPSRRVLAQWMRAHLGVATYPVPDPTHLARLEDDVLHALDPPLNLEGRAPTPVRTRLSALRRVAGGKP